MSTSQTSKQFKAKSRRKASRRTATHFKTISKDGNVPGVEHKFYDTALVDHDIGFLGAAQNGNANPTLISLISTVPRGDNAEQRSGKHIVIDTIIIEGSVQLLPNNSQTAISKDLPVGNVFIALVQNNQTNGVVPSSSVCWRNKSGSTGLMANPMKNLYNAAQFTTLKVWRVDVGQPNAVNNFAAGTVSNQGIYKSFDGYLKVHIPVNFNGGGEAAVENTVDNSILMYAFTNTTANVVLNYNARIRFK